MKFGELLKKHRITLGLNLRKFCLQLKHDPSNWSKLERGLLPPPSDEEVLTLLARQLEIEEDSAAWLEFFDAAYITRGEIPPYVKKNEAMMEKLPLFFRTISGTKPSEQELGELAEFLKNHA